MRAAAALLIAIVAGVLPAPLAAGQDEARISRDQALRDLDKPDIEARRQATAWLGELGTMADAPVLLRALRDGDEIVRSLAENSLWHVWSRSGDPEIDAMFQVGVDQMSRGAAEEAIQTFTAIVERKPDFAEGWNKRATVYYLVGEYDKSLHDCDEVIKRNPDHWGVLSGYGQIYLALAKPERALEYFERALAVNPNLRSVEAAVTQLRRLVIEKRKGTI